MAQTCPNCGSSEFRETLSGKLCANCGKKVDTTSAEISAKVREEDAYPSADSGLVEAGDFQVGSPDIQEAIEAHEDRPEFNQERDEQFRARVTTDVDKWMNDMDSFDFPGVDTPSNRPEAEQKDEPFVDDEFILSDIF